MVGGPNPRKLPGHDDANHGTGGGTDGPGQPGYGGRTAVGDEGGAEPEQTEQGDPPVGGD